MDHFKNLTIGLFFLYLIILLHKLEEKANTIYQTYAIMQTSKKLPIILDFRETIASRCPSNLVTDATKKMCREDATKKCHQQCIDQPHCCEEGFIYEK